MEKGSDRPIDPIGRMRRDNDVVLVLENCLNGWAGTSPEHFVETVQTIDSKAFRVVFDTGNPIAHLGTTEETGIGIEPHCRISCISTSRIAN